ncbi:MAG: hypothetical protein R3F43_25680 [bacterium]
MLRIEAWFEGAHPGFLDAVLAVGDTGKLRGLARRWVADARPWARRMLLDYIADGCDRPGHRALVKALYKAAEGAALHDVVGAFLVAFDRLAPRKLTVVGRWDWRTRTSYQEVELRRDASIPVSTSRARREGRFTRRTRLYLGRRAFRHLRHLGFRDAGAYREAAVATLLRYAEADLTTPENILDAWGLHHLLFGRSPVLDRLRTGTVLAPGASLDALRPAPIHVHVWLDPAARPALIVLLAGAEAGVVRAWALQILRDHHPAALDAPTLDELTALLSSPHEEAQQAGAGALQGRADLGALPLAAWLRLLAVQGAIAVEAICAAARQVVDPARLSLAECVRLARQPVAPVARLGLEWARAPRRDDALAALLPLAGAPLREIRDAALPWLAERLGADAAATPALVREVIDAPTADARAHGLALLGHPRYQDAELIWAALPETPYADVRRFLLAHIERRRDQVDVARGLWVDTLLGLGSGSAARGRALRQIGERLVAHPGEADVLLPLLGVALRGVSGPDRRQGLAVLARAVVRRPSWRADAARYFPEIRFPEAAA